MPDLGIDEPLEEGVLDPVDQANGLSRLHFAH